MSNGPQLFQTKMGQEFYDGTMKRIARALEKIAENTEPKAVPKAPVAGSDTPDYIRKIMEISTAHIDKAAADTLQEVGDTLYVPLYTAEDRVHDHNGFYVSEGPDGAGWLVTVPGSDWPVETTPYLGEEHEELASLVKVIAYAQKQGCRWLMLDRDATELSDLPTYEW